MSENTSILRAENINMSFGMVVAADDVNVVVEPGALSALTDPAKQPF